MSERTADQEKFHAALASIFTAVVLTALKLGVGYYTNSLGMLSEALHSGLDLLAAAVTLFAVRMAALPADNDHAYGHGKAENLAALVETGLLLATCGWIVYEAVDRLFYTSVPVLPSLWGVGVMLISMALDINRVRMLRRVAQKHNSQALEADALHFSSDILSSAVVMVGLLLLWFAQYLPADSVWHGILQKGDAIAALAVAVIVLHACWELAMRAVHDLMDGGSVELRDTVRDAALGVAGVVSVPAVRLRTSGPNTFVDLRLGVEPRLTIEEGHGVADTVEARIAEALPGADVTIHVEPAQPAMMDTLTVLHNAAAVHGVAIHGVHIWQDIAGAVFVELHTEFSGQTLLCDAHRRVTEFEHETHRLLPLVRVVSHIEPQGAAEAAEKITQTCPAAQLQAFESSINYLLGAVPEASECHRMRAHYVMGFDGEPVLALSFHCRMDGHASVEQAHGVASDIEKLVRHKYPDLGRIVIHMEPFDGHSEEDRRYEDQIGAPSGDAETTE